MRTSNPDRLTAATAEQLLDGGPGPAGLQQLLAAAGPGTASELTGETAAIAAFLAAPRETTLPSAPIRRPSMLSTALSKILAAKALAAVVLVAGATGGVALAANATSAPSSSTDETSTTATADAGPTADPDAAPGDAAPADDASKAPTPEPSIIGLCRAWAAGAGDNPGEAAENPAFRSLLEAAGSEKDVPGFCAVRESVDQPGKSGTAPGQADKGPDATTDGATNGGKGGKPTAAPGNPDRPTGPPADRPQKNSDGADGADTEKDTGKGAAKNSDAEDGDAENSGSRGEGERSEQGGQGGGASAEHRPGG